MLFILHVSEGIPNVEWENDVNTNLKRWDHGCFPPPSMRADLIQFVCSCVSCYLAHHSLHDFLGVFHNVLFWTLQHNSHTTNVYWLVLVYLQEAMNFACDHHNHHLFMFMLVFSWNPTFSKCCVHSILGDQKQNAPSLLNFDFQCCLFQRSPLTGLIVHTTSNNRYMKHQLLVQVFAALLI